MANWDKIADAIKKVAKGEDTELEGAWAVFVATLGAKARADLKSKLIALQSVTKIAAGVSQAPAIIEATEWVEEMVNILQED